MVKVISLSDEAYNRLNRIKMNRSFSQIVIELVGNTRKSLRDFSGVISNREAEIMKKNIMISRKKEKLREVKF
jgi:predicted CopG family antitoxin